MKEYKKNFKFAIYYFQYTTHISYSNCFYFLNKDYSFYSELDYLFFSLNIKKFFSLNKRSFLFFMSFRRAF